MGVHLGTHPVGIGQELLDISTTQKHKLGEKAVIGGREYRYVQAGAATLVVGNVLQSAAQVANHQNLTPVAAAIGDTSITVTLGATAATENQYAEGLAIVDTTPGLGYAYPIESHPAANGSAAVTIRLGQPIQVALTTSSRITLVANRHKGVIQAPVTTLTGSVVGVAISALTASTYGWVQVKGEGAVLIAGTPAVGAAVISPSGTAGAAAVDPTNAAVGHVGTMMVTGVSGRVQPVHLNIS